MQRLRKGTEREIHEDIKNVQKNVSLIRSPAIGLRDRNKAEQAAVQMDADLDDDDEENIQYVDARELEKKLEEDPAEDYEMLAE